MKDEFFFHQQEQKLDLSDIESYQFTDYPCISIEYDSSKKTLHRNVPFEEIKTYLGNPSLETYLYLVGIIGDIKANYVVFDARYLYALGYKEIYYKDLVPGDISISYELRVADE